MKKSLVALAVLAAAGAASAQSSVTLFGVVDLGYQYGKSGTDSLTRMGQDGIASSRLGFRGTEDLGGGMNASFWLEAGLNPDSGTSGASSLNNQAAGAVAGNTGLIFNRRSTVSLAGGFGELRLGRDYTATFWNTTVFDPFGTNGVGTNRALAGTGAGAVAGNVTSVRASNAFAYFLPAMGGFYGQAQYYVGENVSVPAATKSVGNGVALRAGFANGPINAAFAYGSYKQGAANTIDTWNIGGSYDMGVAKLMAMYDVRESDAPAVKQTGYLLGATMPLGAGELKGSYSNSKSNAAGQKTNQWAVGYIHNLSKRTAVYATLARVGNSGGASASLNGSTATANQSSTGYDIGLRHTF